MEGESVARRHLEVHCARIRRKEALVVLTQGKRRAGHPWQELADCVAGASAREELQQSSAQPSTAATRCRWAASSGLTPWRRPTCRMKSVVGVGGNHKNKHVLN